MPQPIAGDEFTMVSAAATTLISGRQCAVRALTVMGTGNGTVIMYNIDTAAGTAAGNSVGTLGLTSPTTTQTLPVNINFSRGLVTATTGTVLVGISWS